MTQKTWNVRDQTKEELEELLRRKYKEIDRNYKTLKKLSNIEDAKKLVEEIWRMKSFANTIELELIRREYENGRYDIYIGLRFTDLYRSSALYVHNTQTIMGCSNICAIIRQANMRRERCGRIS